MSETRLTTNGPPVHTTTTTAVTAETPTECVACGQDSDFQRRQAVKICDVESENRQLKFDLESAQSINERKDARIRELEGAMTAWLWHLERVHGCSHVAAAKAAPARTEGGGA